MISRVRFLMTTICPYFVNQQQLKKSEMKFWIVHGPPHRCFAVSMGHTGIIPDNDKGRLHRIVDQLLENIACGCLRNRRTLIQLSLTSQGPYGTPCQSLGVFMTQTMTEQ